MGKRSLRFWKGKESNHRQGYIGASTVSVIFVSSEKLSEANIEKC